MPDAIATYSPTQNELEHALFNARSDVIQELYKCSDGHSTVLREDDLDEWLALTAAYYVKLPRYHWTTSSYTYAAAMAETVMLLRRLQKLGRRMLRDKRGDFRLDNGTRQREALQHDNEDIFADDPSPSE
jgi:hypothetical protein